MYLGFDLGTTNVKAVVVDGEGRVAGTGSAHYTSFSVADQLQPVELMLSSLWDKLNEVLPPGVGGVLPLIALAVAAIVVLWILRRVLCRRKHVGEPLPKSLKIDVSTLAVSGPPDGPPVLELYNLPVRLAAIVLAPAGRLSELPPDDQLPPLLDAIVPGLDKVAALHEPLVRRWPTQVSSADHHRSHRT